MSSAALQKSEQQLDAVFHALADATRRSIVRRLTEGPVTVSELAEPFSISLAAVSKHLDVLERARVVRRQRQGRFQICRLNPRALDEAGAFIEHYRCFWNDALDRFAAYVEER
jgi:DNA-binding transcriptional ArsR family regulator